MTKSKSKSGEASGQSRRPMRPLYLTLIILGLLVSVLAFIFVPDPMLRIMSLATAAWLMWQFLRAIGRL